MPEMSRATARDDIPFALHSLCRDRGVLDGSDEHSAHGRALLQPPCRFRRWRRRRCSKAVMHADVRVIDPVWTTQTIANIHGALVYDTLFGNDGNQKPQPQMVGKYEISPDRLTYTFTLRDGLKFHDGSPVTTKDVIASLKRWGAKDGVGQRLMGFVTKMEPVDDKTFTMVLRGALRHGPGVAGQEPELDRRHHAREGCPDRSAAAGEGGRSAPVPISLPRTSGCRAARRSISRTRTMCRAPRRRPPSRAPRSPASIASSWLDLRSADHHVGADQRRDRLLRAADQRLPAVARARRAA